MIECEIKTGSHPDNHHKATKFCLETNSFVCDEIYKEFCEGGHRVLSLEEGLVKRIKSLEEEVKEHKNILTLCNSSLQKYKKHLHNLKEKKLA